MVRLVHVRSPLGPVSTATLWLGVTQLFDRLLFATFIKVSGVSIEALVMQVQGRYREAMQDRYGSRNIVFEG